MNKLNSNACDDENGNCKVCGHPFSPHLIVAYDRDDLAKGGEMRCQVQDCDCLRTLNFDLGDKEWAKKLDSLLKPPS
jgi:hypothetical protein